MPLYLLAVIIDNSGGTGTGKPDLSLWLGDIALYVTPLSTGHRPVVHVEDQIICADKPLGIRLIQILLCSGR